MRDYLNELTEYEKELDKRLKRRAIVDGIIDGICFVILVPLVFFAIWMFLFVVPSKYASEPAVDAVTDTAIAITEVAK